MMKSVADRVTDKLPRPLNCHACDSPNPKLQSRALMGMRTHNKWPLVWHCGVCGAMVGCHRGTDLPLGLMADTTTRDARYRAHNAFDPLWKLGKMSREEAYVWLAEALGLPRDKAHVSMLNEAQCELVILLVRKRRKEKPERKNWKQRGRKSRRK